jgi:hypothetical protein
VTKSDIERLSTAIAAAKPKLPATNQSLISAIEAEARANKMLSAQA